MENESEKSSYTLKHTEEPEEPKVETYEPISEDAALLSKTETEKPVDVDETTALTEPKADVDPENLTTKKEATQSLKGKFLQLFDRKKPTSDATTESQQNGTTPQPTDPPQTSTKKKFLPPIKIKNPFMKKSESSTPIAPADNQENNEVVENGQKEEATEVPPENCDEKKEVEASEEKPKVSSRLATVLSSVTLPSFSGLVNKFKKAPQADDIEMGNGRKRAGLASMETLDDSTKDPWNQESDSPDGSKPAEKPAEEPVIEEKGPSVFDRIRAYTCSLDDIALIIGLLVFLLLVALIISFTFLGPSKPLRIAPVRDGKVKTVTSCGEVEGILEDSATVFRGIPYAVPPIGQRRFKPAKPLDNMKYCWNGTFEAHKPTSECLQYNNDDRMEGDENCLTLDIITPQVRNYNLLPVIVLIGSDSYLGGQPGPLTPSARFARIRDVLYVRPKFRTNVMGYLALDSISNFSRPQTSGNYALSDIIVALEWIQLNIANFGGDPTSVILFGHRTGATLVLSLTASPVASKLFERAWASSPSAVLPEKNLVDLEEQNKQFAELFRECSNLTCWQNQDASKLFEKVPQLWRRSFSSMLPSIAENHSSIHQFLGLDGVILKKHPIDVWSSGSIASKLVIGTTRHASYEGTTIAADGIYQLINDSKIGEANLTEEVIKRYGATVQGLVSIISDIRTVCPLLVLARTQKIKIPFYVVNQTRGNDSLADVSSDVEGIFARYKIDNSEQRRYADAIRGFFFHYVYHGKVLEYSNQNFVLNIEQDVKAQSDYPNCDFWIQNKFVPHYAAI